MGFTKSHAPSLSPSSSHTGRGEHAHPLQGGRPPPVPSPSTPFHSLPLPSSPLTPTLAPRPVPSQVDTDMPILSKVDTDMPILSKVDERHLSTWGVNCLPHIIFLSFTRNAEDVRYRRGRQIYAPHPSPSLPIPSHPSLPIPLHPSPSVPIRPHPSLSPPIQAVLPNPARGHTQLPLVTMLAHVSSLLPSSHPIPIRASLPIPSPSLSIPLHPTQARNHLAQLGKLSQSFIFAKIESIQGLRKIDEILAEADGLVLGRGDLGIDLPAEKVFLMQKVAIYKANMAGKPCVISRVVDTMTDTPRPTRAEATDVANAVLDGGWGGMGCEAEKAYNQELYYNQAVKEANLPVLLPTQPRTLFLPAPPCPCQAEKAYNQELYFKKAVKEATDTMSELEAMASSAVKTAEKVHAAAIVVFTSSGRMARLVAKCKPPFLCSPSLPLSLYCPLVLPCFPGSWPSASQPCLCSRSSFHVPPLPLSPTLPSPTIPHARLVAKYKPTMPVLTLVIPRLYVDKLRWTVQGEVPNAGPLLPSLVPSPTPLFPFPTLLFPSPPILFPSPPILFPSPPILFPFPPISFPLHPFSFPLHPFSSPSKPTADVVDNTGPLLGRVGQLQQQLHHQLLPSSQASTHPLPSNPHGPNQAAVRSERSDQVPLSEGSNERIDPADWEDQALGRLAAGGLGGGGGGRRRGREEERSAAGMVDHGGIVPEGVVPDALDRRIPMLIR
ncbi:unnamed protein product [Closterium sp. NIES-65]|nr:unnamed protein product [Closterium sp. NIES-65]